MNGNEVAQMILKMVSNGQKIGRYRVDIAGSCSYKRIPDGHAWISNYDVENLWNHKDMPNLKPQCKKIIEALECLISGTKPKATVRKPRKTVDLNDSYSKGDVLHIALDNHEYANMKNGFKEVRQISDSLDVTQDKYDYVLCVVAKVNKTTVEVQPLPCKTNVKEVIDNIKMYGDAASWTRTYSKDDFNISADKLTYKCKAKQVSDVDCCKVFDAKSQSLTMLGKRFENGNSLVLTNDKYWYD